MLLLYIIKTVRAYGYIGAYQGYLINLLRTRLNGKICITIRNNYLWVN
jgi:hypothetical protein